MSFSILTCDRWPRPAEPTLAAVGLAHWHEQAAVAEPAVGEFARALAADPAGRAMLEGVFGNSPYLTQCLVREQGFVRRLAEIGRDAAFTELLAGLTDPDETGTAVADTERLMARLRVAKRRAALLIALADIAGAWGLEQVTGALTDLAETALTLAVSHLLRRASAQGLLTLTDPRHPALGSGLIILGMGKFGARELNYSSDIDLIVLYDAEIVACARAEHLARTFIRLARDLVRIMEERTRDGYVFRTDLRLRPDPGATPPAVSVATAEIYYSSVGQNWERAAMIKARPVAGDLAAGAAFLESLRPFIWRRNLDFAAIQDIHSIKRQINAHRGGRTIAVNDHNLKLGRGGIREIEFFAQTQQLIYGGRDDRVRIAPTCAALAALTATGRVAAPATAALTAAYRFLRQVEHRLQMTDDRQTHSLPPTDAGVAAVATFLGYEDVCDFRAELLGHMAQVEDHYAELFEEAAPLAGPGNLVFTGTDDDPETVTTLQRLGFRNPSGAIAAIGSWHRGRFRATRSARARELLTELVPALLQAFARTADPDTALVNFDRFLGNLPAGIQLFSLFYANPNLLDLVAEIMGMAPRLAETLSRHPALLDAVLLEDFFVPVTEAAPPADGLTRALADARDFEDALLLSRRWVNDQKFRVGVHILRNITDGDRCGRFLSDLAAAVIAEMLNRVASEFARRHGQVPGAEVVVVAMGKLGSGRMTVGSDLDLIVVYDVPPGPAQSDGTKPLAASDYYSRLTHRLIDAITAPTGEGKLYEVDLRLRPSGNAGPIAVSFAGFVKYQAEQAWTWEHMALTRARVIAGSEPLGDQLTAAIRQVLTRCREPDQLLRDVASMRQRIEQEFGTDNPWNVKYRRGGIVDISFIAQYLQLRHGHDHPGVLDGDTVTALGRLAAAGLIDAAIAADLEEAQRLWRRLQSFLRLTIDPGWRTSAEVPPALLTGLARAAVPEAAEPLDFDTLQSRIQAIAALAYRHFQALIERPAATLPPAAPDPESPAP